MQNMSLVRQNRELLRSRILAQIAPDKTVAADLGGLIAHLSRLKAEIGGKEVAARLECNSTELDSFQTAISVALHLPPAGPVGWAFATLEEPLAEARRSAEVTHDHPEGIQGAPAVAAAPFLARQGGTKEEIGSYITSQFGYDLATPLEVVRPAHRFEVSCQGSVPQALRAFLEGRGDEEAVRLAVSTGGDSDTSACMAGGVAEAFHGGVPPAIEAEAWTRLNTRMRATIQAFQTRFMPGRARKGRQTL